MNERAAATARFEAAVGWSYPVLAQASGLTRASVRALADGLAQAAQISEQRQAQGDGRWVAAALDALDPCLETVVTGTVSRRLRHAGLAAGDLLASRGSRG